MINKGLIGWHMLFVNYSLFAFPNFSFITEDIHEERFEDCAVQDKER